MDRSTGPRPALSPVHHTGTHRIQLRIPQRFPQVLLVQRARIISPLPDMPGRMMTRIPIRGIPPLSVLQRQPQTIGIVGHRDQVYMVGHQAVADQFYPVQGNALLQKIQIDPAIRVAGKDKLPSIPTLGIVMRYPGLGGDGRSWWGRTVLVGTDETYPNERTCSALKGW